MKPYYSEGGSTIYCGDCREVLPQLSKSDLIVTDPPYGINLAYHNYMDTEENWFALMTEFIPIARLFATMVVMQCCQISRLDFFYKDKFRQPDWLICWYKGSPGTRSFVGFNDWEAVLVYGKNKGVSMHDYFFMQPDSFSGMGHPCPKPIGWAKWLIKNCCPIEDGTICDPFMGSGTVLRAAKDMNLRAIGIDQSERYCEIAANRLRQEVLFK